MFATDSNYSARGYCGWAEIETHKTRKITEEISFLTVAKLLS